MKKHLLTLLIVFTLSSMMAFGQNSIELTGFYNDELTDYTKSGCYVKNITGSDINIKVRRMTNDLAAGHESFFCWDVCYDETVNISVHSVLIPAGDSVSNFYLTFSHYSIPGTSTIVMRFYDENSTEDYIEHTFGYSIGATAIDDEILAKAFSNPYPNPAKDVAYIDYELPIGTMDVELRIFNLIGKQIGVVSLDNFSGKAKINTTNYIPGVYFIYLVAGNKEITSRKLIVTK